MRKWLLFCVFSVLLFTHSSGQQINVISYDLAQLSLKQPELLGKVGNRFMLLDIVDQKGTPLYILDSTFRLFAKVYLPKEAIFSHKAIIGNNIRFSWLSADTDSTGAEKSSLISMIQVNSEGIIKDLGVVIIPPATVQTPPDFITDKMQQYQFIYSIQVNPPQGLLKGTLLDSLGNIQKQISYEFDFDPFKNQLPLINLDSKGNIHIAVVDKLSNYRISTTITINTIPYQDESIIEESFHFEKIKFNKIIFTDNPKQQTIQIQGYYYDGDEKNKKKGIASIQFPYERNKPVTTRFNLFPDALRMELQKGMSHVRKKDDILNSLFMKNIAEINGQTVMSSFVLNISELDLPSEYKVDAENVPGRGSINADQANSGLSAAERTNMLNRWLIDAQKLNTASSVNLPPYRDGMPDRSYDFYEPRLFTPVVGNGISEMERNYIYQKMDASGPSPLFRNVKLIVFVLDESGYLKNYSIIGNHFFQNAGETAMRMFSYPIIKDEHLWFTGNLPVKKDELAFSLVHTGKSEEPDIQVLPLPIEMQSHIKQPQAIGGSRYLSLVRNFTNNTYSLLEMDFN